MTALIYLYYGSQQVKVIYAQMQINQVSKGLTRMADDDDDDDEDVHLVDADLGLHVLKAFLQDGDERSRRHQSPVDVRLTDVTLDAKRERRVRETCSTKRPAFHQPTAALFTHL